MSASSVLLIVATIISTDGGSAAIDVGRERLLEPGDTGQVFYELVVDGSPKRIEVGPVVVASVDQSRVMVSADSGITLRPGYQVEFRVPVDRRTPPQSEATPQPKAPPPPVATPPAVPTEMVEESGPEPVDLADTMLVTEEEPEPSVPEITQELATQEPVPAAAEPPKPPRDVLEIPGGDYAIGLDPTEADFFNQTPRHEVYLEGFAIDRSVITAADGSPLTGLEFAKAEFYCQELGLRLPSEAQWEIAAQTPGFRAAPDLYEWTASWYEAYPGNTRVEEAYGRTHKVLRGLSGPSADVHARRFMRPDQSNPKVGFRCVGGLD